MRTQRGVAGFALESKVVLGAFRLEHKPKNRRWMDVDLGVLC